MKKTIATVKKTKNTSKEAKDGGSPSQLIDAKIVELSP